MCAAAGALLPMAELLHSQICLDLSGKGLGRVEMGIAAQLLHKNSSLQVLTTPRAHTGSARTAPSVCVCVHSPHSQVPLSDTAAAVHTVCVCCCCAHCVCVCVLLLLSGAQAL